MKELPANASSCEKNEQRKIPDAMGWDEVDGGWKKVSSSSPSVLRHENCVEVQIFIERYFLCLF